MSHLQTLSTRPMTGQPQFFGDAADERRPFGSSPAPYASPIFRSRVLPARRASDAAKARLREYGSEALTTRPRRRLKREFRVAGNLVLLAALLGLAVLLLRVSESYSELRGEVAGMRPPTVSLMSIESPGQKPKAPVILPGYLLPDDGSGTGTEEPDHAGG